VPSSSSLCNNLCSFLAFAPMLCHSILILQEILPRLLSYMSLACSEENIFHVSSVRSSFFVVGKGQFI
jgi:hypothetical protein